MTAVRPTAPAAPPDVVDRWRRLGYTTGEPLGWAVERAAREWPARTAVVDRNGRHTFGEVGQRAHTIAVRLIEAGVARGDVVSWSLPNTVHAIALTAATWRIGAISNPVVSLYRAHEFGFIFDQLHPRVVVSCPDVRGRDLTAEIDAGLAQAGHEPAARLSVGGDPGPPWTPLPAAGIDATSTLGAEPASAGESCVVLYTSGTTSAPKGAVHTSVTLGHEARSMRRAWGLSGEDVMFMASPLTHITGLLQGLLVPAISGARVVLMEGWDPAEAVELIERERATYMAGATPFLRGVVETYGDQPPKRPALRQFCCGGSAVPPDLIEGADTLGIAAYRCWGMTEFPTTTLASAGDPLDRRAHTDGPRAEGVEIQAVGEGREPLRVGEQGELRVRGPERMAGYVDAALDAEVMDEDGWFYTGDLGVVGEDGFVTVTGRLKDVINRGGEKFSAREIEELLARHPAVREVAVLPLPDGRLGESVGAAVVLRHGNHSGPVELRGFLEQQRIAPQKIPASFRFVQELPRTASGKVQKFRLLEAWERP